MDYGFFFPNGAFGINSAGKPRLDTLELVKFTDANSFMRRLNHVVEMVPFRHCSLVFFPLNLYSAVLSKARVLERKGRLKAIAKLRQ